MPMPSISLSATRKVSAPASAPKIAEPASCQLGIPHRVLNISVAEIALERAGIVAVVGELEAGGVAQHVRVRLEGVASGLAGARDQHCKARGREWRVALAGEHERRFWVLFALEFAQHACDLLYWLSRGRRALR